MVRSLSLVPVSVVLVALLAGCPGRNVATVDPDPQSSQDKRIRLQLNRDLDLLFVVDNSGSMRDEQVALAANFPQFINVLDSIEGGLPNLHLGVVSTNAGAAPDVPQCGANGDNGDLQSAAVGSNCPGGFSLTGRYIQDIDDGAGGRTTNYAGGSLAETFSCIAELGTNGCGFEAPLESMKRALDGSNNGNQGFLRPNAFLGVIIISDEDDCSASDPALFSDPNADINSELGPLSSFRCFEWGVQCEPDTDHRDARNPGPRQNCESWEDSPYIKPVQEYIDFLSSIKSNDDLVVVAAISGDTEPVEVGRDAMSNEAELLESCSSSNGVAAPAVRIGELLDGFPQTSASTTICNDNLTDALVVIAELLAEVIGNPCLADNIATPPDCVGRVVMNRGEEDETDFVVPECDASDSNAPCYKFIAGLPQCGASLGVEFVGEGINGDFELECVSEAQ